jgi:hypothetical protein
MGQQRKLEAAEKKDGGA